MSINEVIKSLHDRLSTVEGKSLRIECWAGLFAGFGFE